MKSPFWILLWLSATGLLLSACAPDEEMGLCTTLGMCSHDEAGDEDDENAPTPAAAARHSSGDDGHTSHDDGTGH